MRKHFIIIKILMIIKNLVKFIIPHEGSYLILLLKINLFMRLAHPQKKFISLVYKFWVIKSLV